MSNEPASHTPSQRQILVDQKGHCSLCGGTHYGTGIYRCPYACSKCEGGFNTEPCGRFPCGREGDK